MYVCMRGVGNVYAVQRKIKPSLISKVEFLSWRFVIAMSEAGRRQTAN